MMEHLYGAIDIRVHRMFGSVPSLVILSATSKRRELSGVVMPRDTLPAQVLPFLLILYPVHPVNGQSEV